MTGGIAIEAAQGTWVADACGVRLGLSDRALILREGSYPPVVYFPRADIDMARLHRTDRATACPMKGACSYFSIETPQGRLENAVWSYENPRSGMEAIAGHLAFYTDRISVVQA